MVSEEGTRAGHGYFQRRHQCWSPGRRGYRAEADVGLWLEMDVRRHGSDGICMADSLAGDVSATRRTSALVRDRTRLHSQRSTRDGGARAMAATASISADVGLR